ncbi:uncharacterized protein in vnfD 5'region-like [Lycorma delicatula]|uniref:uncharacterized protein in vnfD 5'region-like n=1 Tax=Lycorma delicatula TaxID=130591 RepID=UPI003F5187CB
MPPLDLVADEMVERAEVQSKSQAKGEILDKWQQSWNRSQGCFTKKALFHTTTSDYSLVVHTTSFIDKTILIKEFLEGFDDVILLTAPRRFGKSTNMDMIKKFCEIELDINTELDFKALSSDSFDNFLETFRIKIMEVFIIHEYMLENKCLNKQQEKEFKKFYYYDKISVLHPMYLHRSLVFLSSILYTHFKKKVIVLIDDYDWPVQEAINYSGVEVDKIIIFIKKFTSNLLKSNLYVEKALINACIGQEGILTIDENNIKHVNFFKNHKFSKFYGFTDEEVKILLKKLKISKKLDDLREWYGGYNVENSDIEIYNPYSVVSYLKSNELKSYWFESGYIVNIDKLFLNEKIHEKIDSFFDKTKQNIFPIAKLDIFQILKLRDMIINIENSIKNSLTLTLMTVIDLRVKVANPSLNSSIGEFIILRLPFNIVKAACVAFKLLGML